MFTQMLLVHKYKIYTNRTKAGHCTRVQVFKIILIPSGIPIHGPKSVETVANSQNVIVF